MKICYWIILACLINSCSSSKDWMKIEVDINEDLHDVEIVNENMAIAYSYGTGNLYKTIDTGKSWNKIYQFDSIYFEQIQFIDEKNGWIVGSPNKIYSTQDGGRNWVNKSLQEESTKSYIYGMWFENKETGFISALERNQKGFITKIFKTQNKGI